jgi:tellurite resistance protein TehA-like permease
MMFVALLLNETSMIDTALWLLGIPFSMLYLAVLVLLWNRRWYAGRIAAFVFALGLAFLGKNELSNLGNEWGAFNLLFFVPLVVGICSLPSRPLKRPVN